MLKRAHRPGLLVAGDGRVAAPTANTSAPRATDKHLRRQVLSLTLTLTSTLVLTPTPSLTLTPTPTRWAPYCLPPYVTVVGLTLSYRVPAGEDQPGQDGSVYSDSDDSVSGLSSGEELASDLSHRSDNPYY